jgi:hypothetical protein
VSVKGLAYQDVSRCDSKRAHQATTTSCFKLGKGTLHYVAPQAKMSTMDYREAVAEASSPRWTRLLRMPGPARLGHHVSEDLSWMQVQSKRGDLDGILPPNFHAVWFAFIQEARRSADLAELAVIQNLGDRGHTWLQVAEALGAGAGTRQAIQQRWKRLRQKYRYLRPDMTTSPAPAVSTTANATSPRSGRRWSSSA